MLPTPNPAVLCRPVPDGAVLLSTVDGVYFGLNRLGARIWDLLRPGTGDFPQLHQILAAEHPSVDAASLRADLVALLDALESNGLVCRGDRVRLAGGPLRQLSWAGSGQPTGEVESGSPVQG